MHPAWSPDGRALAFCSDPKGWYQLGIYELKSKSIRWLEQSEGDDTEPAWSLGARRLVCMHTNGAETSLRVHELSTRTVSTYRAGAGIYAQPRFTHDGRFLLFMFESPRQPADLWQLDLANGKFTQLTCSLPEDIDTSHFAIPEEVWYPSIDGVPVPAMLYRPTAQNAAALVNIHGGPNWLHQCNWHPLMSTLAAQGWAVLAPNYRGSTGYGRAWSQANYMRLGEVDTFDCAAAAHYLVREGLADPTKIVISGRSHGGYLTMTCLTEYPELWAGGSAVVPFMNWFTCHQNARADLQHWDIENFGDPVKNEALWRRRSPFFFLDRIRAAVQLICGANDPRCPASESVAARKRLEEAGKRVEMILYEDEGHSFLKLENVIDHELKRLAFLKKTATGS
jgi:dipeptidyl aminopeptidase/acylaminoacyl peptidase